MPEPFELDLVPGHWTDLPAILRMIVEGGRDGNFNRDFLSPRVLLGAALQLLLVMAAGRLHRPGGTWQPACVQVLRRQRRCLGFTLFTELAGGSAAQASRTQITLFKVAADARSQGLGARMLGLLMSSLPRGGTVETDCMHASVSMQRLLRRHGFRQTTGASSGAQRWQRRIG